MSRKFKHSGFVDVPGAEVARIRDVACVPVPPGDGKPRTLVIEGRYVCADPLASGRALEVSLGPQALGSLQAEKPGEFQHVLPLPEASNGAVLHLTRPARPPKRRSLVDRLTGGKTAHALVFGGEVEIQRITLGGEPLVDFSAGTRTFGGRPTGLGMNVFGSFERDAGVAESARCCVKAAQAAGIEAVLISLGSEAGADPDKETAPAVENPHSVNVFHLEVPQTSCVDETHGAALRKGHYNIGYWTWELPEFPDYWLENFEAVDEVWVPSRFVWEAIAAKSPIPVLVMPHAIGLEPASGITRADLGLPPDEFLFLTLFDFDGSLPRKNPVGAIEAFRRAFGDREGVRLVVKTQHADRHPDELALVNTALRGARNITLLDRTIPRPEMTALQSLCDCVVSLHRAEGFGLGLAEAMRLGKPVIATNWSGNLEYMSVSNSCLVDFDLVPLTETTGPYKRGQIWAEPNLHHAAFWMRGILEEPTLRQRIGAHAQRSIVEKLSPARIGHLYLKRLTALSHWE